MRETGRDGYQSRLVRILDKMFPGCIILRNDPQWITGIPDLVILYEDKWAALEVKASAKSPSRPLQPYYTELTNSMSFGSKIYPENEEEVLDALQLTFRATRQARVP